MCISNAPISSDSQLLQATPLHHFTIISNYNRANDVAGGVALWQPIPRTADVTVNKMAGVRVRILMNR